MNVLNKIAADDISADMFDEVRDAVFMNMNNDSFLSFKFTKSYNTLKALGTESQVKETEL